MIVTIEGWGGGIKSSACIAVSGLENFRYNFKNLPLSIKPTSPAKT
jgi:hypothetical protein